MPRLIIIIVGVYAILGVLIFLLMGREDSRMEQQIHCQPECTVTPQGVVLIPPTSIVVP